MSSQIVGFQKAGQQSECYKLLYVSTFKICRESTNLLHSDWQPRISRLIHPADQVPAEKGMENERFFIRRKGFG